MGRKRNMPSRKKIFEYWQDKLSSAKDDNTCFRCNSTSIFGDSIIVDRAHILAVCEGGGDDVNNIHLLCKSCHKESEWFNGELYDLWLKTNNQREFIEITMVLYDDDALNKSNISLYELFDKYISKCVNDFKKSDGEATYGYMMHKSKERWINEINDYKQKVQ